MKGPDRGPQAIYYKLHTELGGHLGAKLKARGGTGSQATCRAAPDKAQKRDSLLQALQIRLSTRPITGSVAQIT
jgi:hypothetical protein